MAFGFTYTLPTITGTHANFPVLMTTGNFPVESINGGASSVLNGGGNLRAYTDDTKTTPLPLEVVQFVTGGAPQVQIWVKVPSAQTGATIYLESDDVETTQPPATDPLGRNAVWPNYLFVTHFADDPTSRQLVNSSGAFPFATVLTQSGGDGDLPIRSDDDIGFAWQFSDSNAFDLGTFQDRDQLKSIHHRVLCSGQDAKPLSQQGTTLSTGSPTWLVTTRVGTYSMYVAGYVNATTPYSVSNYQNVTYGLESQNNHRLFVDGNLEASITKVTASNAGSLIQGATGFPTAYGGNHKMSLFTVANFFKQQDWLTVEYENQNDPDNWGTSSPWSGGAVIGITTTTGELALSSNPVTIQFTGTVDVPVTTGQITYSDNAVSVDISPPVEVGFGQIEITSNPVLINPTVEIDVRLGTVLVSSFPQTIDLVPPQIIPVNASLGTLEITGNVQTIDLIPAPAIDIGVGQITYSENTQGISLVPPTPVATGQIEITSNPAQITFTGLIDVNASTGQVLIINRNQFVNIAPNILIPDLLSAGYAENDYTIKYAES